MRVIWILVIAGCKGKAEPPDAELTVSAAPTAASATALSSADAESIDAGAIKFPDCADDEWIYGTGPSDPMFCALVPDESKCSSDADCKAGQCVDAYLVTARGEPLRMGGMGGSQIIMNKVCKYPFGVSRPHSPVSTLDSGPPRTARDRARAAIDKGDLELARRILDRHVFSGIAPSDEVKVLRDVCERQGDQPCIDKIKQLYRK